ncbi:DnaB-like helicase C-terminal domain-containing protein [Burkholderia pseudomallei]|uniref:DnaB-like helicase C-terminal domain-containing protein n=1 Tax=Burkholderia pseudomallei TaxID=28450 RepID=UPI000F053459|nr:DnaB-like helicase C-terminal domain-containing protein [Burkholderia pseudomallei]VBI24397.1 replicative DNA helicase [Burkholderia pseudomallei]
MSHTHESESNLVSKGPCDNCGSSDANAEYDDGHTHCFSCGNTVQVDGNSTGREGAVRRAPEHGSPDLLRGEYRALGKRGIAEETCRRYGYLVGKDRDGEPVQIATYCDSTGSPVAQKLRTPEKSFVVLGKLKHAGLFGQHLFRSKGKRVIVTEGEIDCLSVAQALSLKWPVVSVQTGAQGAAKCLAAQIEWLKGFDEIVLWFDNDEPGREAVEACAKVLPVGRVKFITTPFDLKDANDLLREHGPTAVVSASWEAKDYRPDGVITGADLTKDRLKAKAAPGWQTPYPLVNEMTRGIRPRQLWLLTAGTGVGKSTDAREFMYAALCEGKKVGALFLEESVEDTGKYLVALDNGVPAEDLEDNPDILTEAQWDTSIAKLFTERYQAYDHFGSTDSDALVGKMEYMALQGAELLFLDHLTIAATGLDNDGQDELLTKLRSMVERTGCSVVAIAHVRKEQSGARTAEEGAALSLSSIKGSGSLKQIPDVIIAKERNQQAEDEAERDISQIRVLKVRRGGKTGPADRLKYDVKTGRVKPLPREDGGGLLELDESAEAGDDCPF